MPEAKLMGMSPMTIAERLFEKTGEESYGKIKEAYESLFLGDGKEDLKAAFAHFDNSRDDGCLKAIVRCLNARGNVNLLEEAGRRNVASLDEGGIATASCQYDESYGPERAFSTGGAPWLSKGRLKPPKRFKWIEIGALRT